MLVFRKELIKLNNIIEKKFHNKSKEITQTINKKIDSLNKLKNEK